MALRTAFGRDFDVPTGYLNTASIGIPPADAADAVADAVAAWRRGGTRAPDFDAPVARARAAFARLVGAGGGTAGINTAGIDTAGIDTAGIGMAGIGTDGIGTRGTRTDGIGTGGIGAGGTRTDGIGTGGIGAGGIGAGGIGTERVALGWLDADLSFADAVVAAGYKWLLCPRGAAWLALHPDLLDPARSPRPLAAGWYAADDPWSAVYDLPWRPGRAARAYDSSPAWLSHVGAAVSLPWLAGLDRAAVQTHCVGLADTLRAGLDLPPAGSAITALRRSDAAARLAEAGIVASTRAGATRLAFHLYNTVDDVERALTALR